MKEFKNISLTDKKLQIKEKQRIHRAIKSEPTLIEEEIAILKKIVSNSFDLDR